MAGAVSASQFEHGVGIAIDIPGIERGGAVIPDLSGIEIRRSPRDGKEHCRSLDEGHIFIGSIANAGADDLSFILGDAHGRKRTALGGLGRECGRSGTGRGDDPVIVEYGDACAYGFV